MKSKPKMQKPKNKFLSVVLPLELYDRVNSEASAVDRSMSKYVELLLRDTFHEIDVKRDIAARQAAILP